MEEKDTMASFLCKYGLGLNECLRKLISLGTIRLLRIDWGV